jgi:two-component system, response regulator RegA
VAAFGTRAVIRREPRSFRAWRKKTLGRLEEEFLRRALKEHGGNVTRTATALGVHRSTLQRLMRKHALPAANTGSAAASLRQPSSPWKP